MKVKIGFSEIALLCSVYLYTHSQVFSIVLAVIAVLGAVGDYAIRKEEKSGEESDRNQKSIYPSGHL